MVKNPPANAGDGGSSPGSGRSPGGGKSHGQRSLAGYSPPGRRELDRHYIVHYILLLNISVPLSTITLIPAP